MSHYDVDKIFDELKNSINFQRNLTESNYKDYLDKYIEIANPDFVAVLSTKSIKPVLFEKNFNLQFEKAVPETVEGLISCSNFDQSGTIFEMDSHMLQFMSENREIIETRKSLYSIKSNVELKKDEITSLRRDVILLSKDNTGLPQLFLVAWFDVTELYGTKLGLLVNIRDYSDRKKENESLRQKLLKKLNQIITPKILHLTKREKQVLQLISQGKTSKQIAQELNISKSTVDKHRQNIIKKNDVNNTSAILKSI